MFYENEKATAAINRLNLRMQQSYIKRDPYRVEGIRCCILEIKAKDELNQIKGTIYYKDGGKIHIEPVLVRR